MSRQFDFFAHPNDLVEIEHILRRALGEYLITENTRGPASSLIPHPVQMRQACERAETKVPFGRAILIVPPWAANRLHPVPTHREGVPGELIVHTHLDPALEYECSFFDSASHIVHRGRFYWSYLGSLQGDQMKSIERLFRALRKASERFDGSSFLRVFPRAKELARGFVLDSGTEPVRSPYGNVPI